MSRITFFQPVPRLRLRIADIVHRNRVASIQHDPAGIAEAAQLEQPRDGNLFIASRDLSSFPRPRPSLASPWLWLPLCRSVPPLSSVRSELSSLPFFLCQLVDRHALHPEDVILPALGLLYPTLSVQFLHHVHCMVEIVSSGSPQPPSDALRPRASARQCPAGTERSPRLKGCHAMPERRHRAPPTPKIAARTQNLRGRCATILLLAGLSPPQRLLKNNDRLASI